MKLLLEAVQPAIRELLAGLQAVHPGLEACGAAVEFRLHIPLGPRDELFRLPAGRMHHAIDLRFHAAEALGPRIALAGPVAQGAFRRIEAAAGRADLLLP